MSRSLPRLFLTWTKNIFLNDTRYKSNNELQIKLTSSVFTIGALTHCIYTFSTSNYKKLIIVKKYKMVRNGFTEFMIIDIYGNHYNVNNSFWFWKWNSVEDWNNIKEGDKVGISYYGWRVPILGLFPNVYYISITF